MPYFGRRSQVGTSRAVMQREHRCWYVTSLVKTFHEECNMVKKRRTVLQHVVDAMVILLLVSGAFVALPDEVLGQNSGPVVCLTCPPSCTSICGNYAGCNSCPCIKNPMGEGCLCSQAGGNPC